MYVLDVKPGAPAAPGRMTCGECGLLTEITDTFRVCCAESRFSVLFVTDVRQPGEMCLNTNRARLHTVSVVGDIDAASKYLYSRDGTHITKVDGTPTAVSSNQWFPMNLTGLSFKFARYLTGRRGRRFIMSTQNHPIFDKFATCDSLREGDYYITNIYWNFGPVSSIRVLRWAVKLGSIVNAINLI